ncbi:hypothetical protein [Kaarinaea lacus]
MRIKAATLLSAMLVATLATPIYVKAATSESMAEVFKSCEKEAESNEVDDKDMRNWLKRCMTDNGLTSADADSTLEELGPPPAENTSGESSGS